MTNEHSHPVPSYIRDDSICESSLNPNKSSGDIVELKPCPSCGGAAHTTPGIVSAGLAALVMCSENDCATVGGATLTDATARWNTRTPDPESAAEIERLRREVEDLQRALLFWMPGVDLRLDEATRECAAQDAALLVGYSGTTDGPCWGDGMLDRALTAESAVAAAMEVLKPFAACVFNDNGDMSVTASRASYDDFVRAYFTTRASAIRAAGSKKTAESGHSA